jgi:hypothetical protein
MQQRQWKCFCLHQLSEEEEEEEDEERERDVCQGGREVWMIGYNCSVSPHSS